MRFSALTVLLIALFAPAAFAEPTLLVRMTPQVVEPDQSVSWEQPLSKECRPGTPVVVNIDAEGLSIRVTVTPFVQGEAFLLVVQGEVRQKKATGVRGSSTVQSLLVPPGEPIAYFPLGRGGEGARQMVVFIRVETVGE